MFKKTFNPLLNPYKIQGPVSKDRYYGRDNDYKIIENWLLRGSSQIIWVTGGRASGKTSLLKLLQASQEKTVYCDLAGTTDPLLKIGQQMIAEPPFQQFSNLFSFENNTFTVNDLQNLLERCLEIIHPKKLFLLGDNANSADLLSWVKKLASVYVVITSAQDCPEGTLGLRKRQLHDLTEQDTTAIIKQPVEGNLVFAKSVPALVYRLTGGQPFFTQYLCYTLVNHVNVETRRQQVVAKDLDKVLEIMVRTPSDYLVDVLRSHLEGVPEPLVLSALALTVRNPQEYVNRARLLKTVKSKSFPVDEAGVADTLAWLKHNSRLLDWQSDGYRFRVDLLRHWLAYTATTNIIPNQGITTAVEEFLQQEAYEEKRKSLLEGETVNLERYETYSQEVETFLKNGEITLKERQELDQQVEKNQLSAEEAIVAENQVREQLQREFLDWATEYQTNCQAYPQGIPKDIQRDLYATYIARKRVTKAQVEEWSQSREEPKPPAQFTVPEDENPGPPLEEKKETPAELPEVVYTHQLETYLQAGPLTVKERIELDSLVARLKLTRTHAMALEKETRERLHLKPLDWVQEYRANCHRLKQQYAGYAPRRELKRLKVYVATDRVARDKATEILQFMGLSSQTAARYGWLAVLVGAVVIAGITLYQLNPLLTPVERKRPEGQVKGINTSYREGEQVTYSLSGHDNMELQTLAFSVTGTPVQETWPVSGQNVLKEDVFSTKGWQVDQGYNYVFTVTDKAGNVYKTSGTFRVNESVPPTAKLSGIEDHYPVGAEIHYTLEASDNDELERMTFAVEVTLPVEKATAPAKQNDLSADSELKAKLDKAKRAWDRLDLQRSQKTDSFSTQELPPGNYTCISEVLDKAGNSVLEKRNFTLVPPLAETSTSTTPAVIPPLPVGNVPVGNVAEQLQQCAQFLRTKQLARGKGGTALECYQQVLSRDAGNVQAKEGLQKVEAAYIDMVESALNKRQVEDTRYLLEGLRKVNPNSSALPRLEKSLQDLAGDSTLKKPVVKPEPPSRQNEPAPKPTPRSTSREADQPRRTERKPARDSERKPVREPERILPLPGPDNQLF